MDDLIDDRMSLHEIGLFATEELVYAGPDNIIGIFIDKDDMYEEEVIKGVETLINAVVSTLGLGPNREDYKVTYFMRYR